MKIVFALVASLAFGFPLSGQITVAITASWAGSAIRIRNDAALPLNAIALRVQWKLRGDWPQAVLDLADVPARIYFDSLIEPSATPLPPHEERVLEGRALATKGIPLGDPSVSIGEPIVTAGIFADGSTTGDLVL